MRRKQYLMLSLVSLLLGGGAASAPALAQQKESTTAAPARQEKVKILKQEGDTYSVLDTTLTLANGMTFEEAIRKLQAKGDFKRLKGKPLKAETLSHASGDVIRYFPSQGQDSLGVAVLKRALSDSAFTSIKGVSVLRAHPLNDSLKGVKIRAIYVKGNPVVVQGADRLDSLVRHQGFFRVDSALRLSADSFLRQETIRVEKDSVTGNVKVTRIRKGSAPEVIESGDFNVIRLRNANQDRIIFLHGKATAPVVAGMTGNKGKKEAEAVGKLALQLSPNPTNDEVNLSFFSQKKAKAQVRVVDSQARTVYQEDLGNVQGQLSKKLSLSSYGRGVYVIQVQVGKTMQSGKVVVQ